VVAPDPDAEPDQIGAAQRFEAVADPRHHGEDEGKTKGRDDCPGAGAERDAAGDRNAVDARAGERGLADQDHVRARRRAQREMQRGDGGESAEVFGQRGFCHGPVSSKRALQRPLA
jgi:hypothetical protein